MSSAIERSTACRALARGLTLGMLNPTRSTADTPADWRPNYVVASSLYGTLPLADILPEVGKTGAGEIDLGPFRLEDETAVLNRLGGHTIVTTFFAGKAVPRNVEGEAAKKAVGEFVEKIRPTAAAVAEAGVTVAIENHGNALVCSLNSIRYLADLAPEAGLGVALAPYHLPQDPQLLAGLVEHLGDKRALFYAWQYGEGCNDRAGPRPQP